MLAIINLTLMAPNADLLLLSAMMKNTQEVADWIKAISGRECLPLDLAWNRPGRCAVAWSILRTRSTP